jgi:hypothetical protein
MKLGTEPVTSLSTPQTAGWRAGIQFLVRARNFSSFVSVQIGSGANPSPYSVDIEVSSPGGKAAGRVKLNTHHLVQRLRIVELHPIRFRGIALN